MLSIRSALARSFVLLPLTCPLGLAGCAADAPGADDDATGTAEAAQVSATTRVYGVVAQVLPAADHDGVAGDECVVLVTAELRARALVLVEPAPAGASCQASAFAAGDALSFTWGDTTAYRAAGRAALRTAVGSPDAAVHTLAGTLTSEAAAFAELGTFLAKPAPEQLTALGTPAFTAKRVHSTYDFVGAAQVAAEAAYASVKATGTCENPGIPTLSALVKDGYVHGYVASNAGSCHSGWFSKRATYDRTFTLLGRTEYSE